MPAIGNLGIVRLKDIAKLANVSPSTVSKVINGKDASISTETREKILSIVHKFQYTPYGAAGSNLKTWRIGVILRSSVAIDSTLDGIVNRAQQRNYVALTLCSDEDSTQEEKNLQVFSRQKVDGIIWEPVAEESLILRNELESCGVPVLLIGPYGGDTSLLLPYEEAAYRITDQLVKLGHSKIGCLISQGRRKENFLSGFRKCLFDNDISFSPRLIQESAAQLLNSQNGKHTITGVVASHFSKALEFLDCADSLGYRIPADFSLISLRNDDYQFSSYPNTTQISTYTMRNSDFGGYLCDKLLNTIEGKVISKNSFDQEFFIDNFATIAPPNKDTQRQIAVLGPLAYETRYQVDYLPHQHSPATVRAKASLAGGAGLLQSVTLAKLGHRVIPVGITGSDSAGNSIFSVAKEQGLEMEFVQRHSTAPTGEIVSFRDDKGKYSEMLSLGANRMLDCSSLGGFSETMKRSDCLLVHGTMPPATVACALELADQTNCKAIFRLGNLVQLEPDYLKFVDILVCTINEVDHWLQRIPTDTQTHLPENAMDSNQILDFILSLGASSVVLLGTKENGKIEVASEDFSTEFQGPGCDWDSRANADIFTALLASQLLNSGSLKQAVWFALQNFTNSNSFRIRDLHASQQ